MLPVAVLGATGTVGQKFIRLLNDHPYFVVKELVASQKSAGRSYKQACTWLQSSPIPPDIAEMTIKELYSPLESTLVFSGLDSSVAGAAEVHYATKGHTVISNAKNHRMDPCVPLLIPEINPDHLDLIHSQDYKGCIVTNPNCASVVAALPLAPLHSQFGLKSVYITSMQAISGAGYPGVSGLEITENIIPFIEGEEEKLESETKKILGVLKNQSINHAKFDMHALCTRVPVIDGHALHLIVEFEQSEPPAVFEKKILSAWNDFVGIPQVQKLPLAPARPVIYLDQKNRPQPRLDRDSNRGMSVSLGRLKPVNNGDKAKTARYSFFALGHNTIRGAAGAALLNAEYMYAKRLFG